MMRAAPIATPLLVIALSAALFATAPCGAAEPAINFQRDIRPILSSNCFACHGPDEAQRQGGFRLDQKESAFGEADSGARVIVPGDTEASELLARIEAEDPWMRMPPPDSNKELKPEQRQLLRAWIAGGAAWEEHWAFSAPRRPQQPAVSNPAWSKTPVDDFILARLDQENLQPSPEADKVTLIRRVTFDLTGLPPTLEEIEAFVQDESDEAYERLVDRLLRSPRYGEHMARFWLDAARYGDTHGLHLDNYREMWPYRDWVINAFNDNMPFDQFTIEQLAGDLLPHATLDQQVASGFNRCHVTTAEGGSIEEEVYVRNVVDRVVTTGTVFMGLTFDCTRCHNHKYDPLTQRDFYSMFAFFNNLDGSPLDGNSAQHAPVAKVPTADQQQSLDRIDQELAELSHQIREAVAQVPYDPSDEPSTDDVRQPREYVWLDDQVPEGAQTSEGSGPNGPWQFVSAPEPVYQGTSSSRRSATGLSQHYFQQAPQALLVGAGDKLFAYVYLDPQNPPREIMLQWNTGDWKHRAYWGENLIEWGTDGTTERRAMGPLPATGQWVRLEVDAQQVGIAPGSLINGWAFTQFDGTVYWDYAGAVTSMPQPGEPFETLESWVQVQRSVEGQGLPKPVQQLVMLESDKRTDEQSRALRDYFVEHAYAPARETFQPLHARQDALEAERKKLNDAIPTTLVFRERKELRPAYVLNRGEYDQHREEVGRAVPAVLPPMPEGAPLDRYGLAQWLVSPQHPLTARVTVNRFWQQLFGTGLVKTSNDFGSQGEPPSHPDLLDWMAVEFRESGWDVKRLMKTLVMSATYRQSSVITPELYQRDSDNRLLARGPRFRLDAEMLRDQALSVSGLLVSQMGGPSVKPPQPPGLWSAVGYTGSNTARFTPDHGPDKVHRRTVYTFIKRTSPPPQMSTFDAPSRESCTVRRERTNTPLQALLLMNDPQFVEAARGLAARALREAGPSDSDRAGFMFRVCTARSPQPEEVQELVALYEAQRATYQQSPEAATKLLQFGEAPVDVDLDTTELAAWTLVANLVLNLDEVVTKN